MNTDSKRRVPDSAAQWRSALTVLTGALLLYLSVSGLVIYLLPFGVFPQANLLVHTLVGILALPVLAGYVLWHWRLRRGGNLSHYQLLGYLGSAVVALCFASGLVVTWQGISGPAMTAGWELAHLVTGLALPLMIGVHLATVALRKVKNSDTRRRLHAAQGYFWAGSALLCGGLLAAAAGWTMLYSEPSPQQPFADDYDWTFGPDRPFAPSLARLDAGDEDPEAVLEAGILALLDDGERREYAATLARLKIDASQHQHYAGDQAGLFAAYRKALGALGDLEDERARALDGVFAEVARLIRKRGSLVPGAMAGSERCGSCHEQIYQEWLPSAHRYSSMDDLFQVVQEVMAEETSPAHTRYCAGCHDPISLFSGAKNSGNITLSAEGSHEGISCVACHSISRADIQGNADYSVTPPRRYLYEYGDSEAAVLLSDFLVRTYPEQHVQSYSRPLYKTAEYCAACHKQYMDVDLNTNIGRVQGQNQYDSWARSRWHLEDDPEETVNCRECHMPLQASHDPAAGDVHDYNRTAGDGKHRSHRFLGGNQYVPLLHDLEGAEEHVLLTDQWLRGEIEIPEIAHKWADGPVVRMSIEAPARLGRGETSRFRVVLTNNKTGHDFPTGPLDMIESWLEVTVTDDTGRVLHHSGGLDERDAVVGTTAWFKADAFDREGELIDRHNLWDLVGKSYSRSLYPGVTDRVEVPLECPSIARRRQPVDEQGVVAARASGDPGEPRRRASDFQLDPGPAGAGGQASALHIEAVLWYRKANPDFLDLMYGADSGMRAPVTEMNRASVMVPISDAAPSGGAP